MRVILKWVGAVQITLAITLAVAVLASIVPVSAQGAPSPSDKKVKYSPYHEEDFPNQVFLGDTSYSTDAGMGCTLVPRGRLPVRHGRDRLPCLQVPPFAQPA